MRVPPTVTNYHGRPGTVSKSEVMYGVQQNYVTVNDANCNVTVRDIADAICAQSKGKRAGSNGLFTESFIYASPELWIHLILFFTTCIKHCILPDCFMEVVITPLIKNKGGNLTDINNYRATALSNVDTKIFERLLLSMTNESVCDGDNISLVSKLVTRLRCVLGSSKKLLIIILRRAAMCLHVL